MQTGSSQNWSQTKFFFFFFYSVQGLRFNALWMAEFHPSGNYLCHIRQPRSSTATSWQSLQPDSHRCADNTGHLISKKKEKKKRNILHAWINKHYWSHRKIVKINVTNNPLLTYYCSAGGYQKLQAYLFTFSNAEKLQGLRSCVMDGYISSDWKLLMPYQAI